MSDNNTGVLVNNVVSPVTANEDEAKLAIARAFETMAEGLLILVSKLADPNIAAVKLENVNIHMNAKPEDNSISAKFNKPMDEDKEV